MSNFKSARKYHFIYKTTNLINGKYYIGMHSTNELNDGYIGSGKYLWYSIRKYGIENFKCEILEFLPDRTALANREKELINEDTLKDLQCMNLKKGGHGGLPWGGGYKDKDHAKHFAKSGKRAFLEKMKDPLYRSNFGKKTSERNYCRANNNELGFQKNPFNWSGLTHSDATKKKISQSKKGNGTKENNSQFGTCWITNGVENKKIKKTGLNDFIKLGWKLGRIFI